MTFSEFQKSLRSNEPKTVILDTDTYNEIDDQFALAWAVLQNQKKIKLLSINAAPFLNDRSISPEDGMIKSYNEIANLLKLIKNSGYDLPFDPEAIPYYKGSTTYLPNRTTPVESDAARNIVKTVSDSAEPVYVLAVGAITNVASAILMKPEIVNNMAVIWLGGHAWNWAHTREFNMVQDVPAAQVIFDSKVPVLQIPCCGVCDHLATTIPELREYLSGKGELCDYLFNIVKGYTNDPFCWSKVIWDISAVAALLCRNAYDAVALPTPILTDDCHYAYDDARHPMLYVRNLNRDRIFKELFTLIMK